MQFAICRQSQAIAMWLSVMHHQSLLVYCTCRKKTTC